MQHKVIQTSNTKKNKDKNDSKKSIAIINTIITNNSELSKHKSHELYTQYSPSSITNNNNNNMPSNNNSKKNTTLANTIKQIIHYSGTKKTGSAKNNVPDEKTTKMNEKIKTKSSKEYTNININDINLKQEENIAKKLKKNNLDNILSESDSCQEIDSMEEDSLSKGNRIKSSNMNLKNISNMKWDNNINFKKHLTSGYNKSNNLKENKNSKSSFTKQKTLKEKKKNNLNINDNNGDTDEEIIVNDNEFDNSRCIQNDKLNETKFPQLSTNPFMGNSILQEGNNNNSETYQQSISSKINNKLKIKNDNNNEKEKIILSNHHIKSSTLGTIKQSSTKYNSSNLSNTVDVINNNNSNNIDFLVKKHNNEKSNTLSNNNNINTNNNIDSIYRNLLSIAKKGDREKFLEILEQIFSLPSDLINVNYQDEEGSSALHYSCDEGNLKIVEILLKANCETNIKNNKMKTPLHLASKRGYFDISKKLIENGALLNVYDLEKNSPLHYVCMHNHVELLKYFLGKLPQANSKNIYDKMPIDLTTNKEMKDLLENYLKKNENSYHKIKIYQTSDSKMKNLIELCPGELLDEEDINKGIISYSNKNNVNISIKNSINSVKKNNNSLSRSPSNKSPRNKLRNRQKEYNSIQPSSNITKKNTINIDLKSSKNNNNYFENINNQNNNNNSNNNNNNNNIISSLNASNIKQSHNNTINTKSNINSVIKKSDLKTSAKLKENKKKDNTENSKKNNKVLIQDTNMNTNANTNTNINKTSNNNKNKYHNNYNSILNKNTVSGLKKTKTVEQFSSISSNKNNNINKINLYNSSNKGREALNDSRINTSNYCNININNSINNGINRINISFNVKKNDSKKLNKSINRFDKKISSGSENNTKLVGNNIKHKNLLLDSIESNNNIINLNKTEENINNISKLSKISKTSLKKVKNANTNSNNSKKNNNNKNYNTIKIVENKEKTLSKSKNKNNKNQNKNKKKESPKNNNNDNSYINNNNNNNINNINNININNCNISKISCGPQTKNNALDPINKSNIIDQTLADNIHAQLNLNSIEEERITPSSFICLAQLGKGSFGEVYLVQKINTQEKFAMKVLRKERIMGQNLLKYAIAERNVLSLSNHPFIVKLNFAFQTSSKLFLILEYCPNGDLAKHLLFEKRFSEEKAKFYICEVLLALENLHQRDIIFRDLKPDNVVLDEEGHCKLTDFGLSKEGVNENQFAKSFCGSIAYLAPEMLKKQGHGKAVDWYLLGVLFYEMLVGITPFFTTRKEDIFHNIEFGELKIPEFISESAASLLRGLLQKDPNKRLGGSIKDAQEIKEHPYFKDVDWDNVYNKKIPPPAVNIFTNKMMHVYHRPRLFANDDCLNKSSDKPNPNMLSGWSFINNEES